MGDNRNMETVDEKFNSPIESTEGEIALIIQYQPGNELATDVLLT